MAKKAPKYHYSYRTSVRGVATRGRRTYGRKKNSGDNAWASASVPGVRQVIVFEGNKSSKRYRKTYSAVSKAASQGKRGFSYGPDGSVRKRIPVGVSYLAGTGGYEYKPPGVRSNRKKLTGPNRKVTYSANNGRAAARAKTMKDNRYYGNTLQQRRAEDRAAAYRPKNGPQSKAERSAAARKASRKRRRVRGKFA